MPCRGAAVSAEGAGGCVWVASDRGLAQAQARWRGIIGLDTEFQRTDTFFPIPGLYQVASETGIWLIDPLAIRDWTPLIETLADPGTVKILHACSEDLELLYRHLDVRPEGVFDTQLAYAFLAENFSSSYAGLVEALLGEKLAKHHTRSNWLKRPLSDDQLRYAQDDVVHLIELHDVLKAELESTGRWHWFIEDMRRRGRYAPREPSSYFAGVKKAWQLDAEQLAVLKRLCEWRERRAMAEDVPRNRIVWDEHLFEFARHDVVDLAETQRMLPPGVARRYGKDIVRVHGEGRKRPPETPLPQPLGRKQKGMLKRLRDIGRRRAQELGIAPELLARQRDLEECIRRYRSSGVLSETFLGWRNAFLGSDLLAELGERA